MLRFIQSRSHQRDYRPNAGLVHFHAVEEPLHDNDRVVCFSDGAMQVEKKFRLEEAWWNPVPWWSVIDGASAIRNQFTGSVVDGNHQSLMHQPRPRIETDAKLDCRPFCDSALGQIRMRIIDAC